MEQKKWHILSTEQALAELESSEKGLSSAEAAERLRVYGTNEIEEKKKESALRLLFEQFTSILVVVLIAAGLVSFAIGEIVDGSVILAIVVINGLLGFYQERKAENALEALRKMTSIKTTVIRDEKTVSMDSKLLVPGDIIRLEAGDKVPADCRILEQFNVKLDESVLTGESVPATKDTKALGDAVVPDRINMVFSGTNVVYGNCTAAVAETGMRTEFGKIASKLQEKEEATPLQRRLAVLGKQLSFIIMAIAAVVFIAGSFHGIPLFEMFLVAVSLAVAAIPEGLPAIVTITLAIGLVRMSRKNAIVRRLPAVESLGSVTVICCDKTGTLTKNEMTVRKTYVDGEMTDFDNEPGENDSLELLLTTGMLCNNATEQTGDPTEIALIKSARKYGLKGTDAKRLSEIPFDSERKMMSVVYDVQGKKMFTKGAVEEVLKRCNKIHRKNFAELLTGAEKQKILEVNQALTKDALRVLAFAYKPVKDTSAKEDELIFVGLQAMIDPPRAEVKESIAKCYTAGIKVVMITGDHRNTAEAIGKELGITGKAITGEELEAMKDDEFEKIVEDIAIYARTSPDHKSRITETLRKKGHIVAMSGDGVNDAPAIKKADIGIAVGSGTEVTKEAADMVLLDDNFSTIVGAIEEGRGIYDNIKKFVNYMLSANFGEILVIFTAIMVNLPLPLLPLQILWINITTDGLPALALGVEKPDKDIMRRKPRDPKEKILNKATMTYILTIGLMLAVGVLLLFISYLPDLERARTVAFTSITVGELFLAVNFRSHLRITQIGLFSNPKLLLAIASSLALQLMVVYLPVFNVLFDTVPLGLREWAGVISFGVVLFLIVEIIKTRIDKL